MSDLLYLTQQRLQQINVTKTFAWQHNKLLAENEIYNLEFWETLPPKYIGYIDVPLDSVIGTNHPDYGGKRTWFENVGYLKRFKSYYNEVSCRKYFDSDNVKSIYFYKYGENYYITADGNHRVHIAKFLGYKQIKGHVTECTFDKMLFDIIQEYKNESIHLTWEAKNIHREAIYKISFMNFTYLIHGFEKLKEFIELFKITKPSLFNYLILLKLNNIKLLSIQNPKDYHISKKDNLRTISKMLSALKYKHLLKKST